MSCWIARIVSKDDSTVRNDCEVVQLGTHAATDGGALCRLKRHRGDLTHIIAANPEQKTHYRATRDAQATIRPEFSRLETTLSLGQQGP